MIKYVDKNQIFIITTNIWLTNDKITIIFLLYVHHWSRMTTVMSVMVLSDVMLTSSSSFHNLLAINNVHAMRQAADTGTCSDTSAVKGIDACGRTVACRLCTDAFYSCALTT